MIPLKLTIEGIYSYRERQIIDFEELTTAGLFGILGTVGSGKSSILEAITYALYGETDRLNARDKRAYNMLNLKSDRAYIEFDFQNHENRTFRCVRELRRNSKNFEDVKVQQVIFYEFKNNAWHPLEHSDAEQIIGLSYNNFKRTIIIPQGQFKEFLELGAKDRTTMMKEIFQLHRFDLQDKVAALNSDNKSKLDQIEGRLIEFDSVNEVDIVQKKTELDVLSQQLTLMEKEHALLNERYQQLKSLKDDYLKLQQLKLNFEEQQKLQPLIEEKQKKLETYERIFARFDRLISDLNRNNSGFKTLQTALDKETKNRDASLERLKDLKNSLTEILPYYDLLNEKRKEESDLELIAQIIDFNAQIATLNQRSKKGEAMVKEADEVLKNIISEIKQAEIIVKELANQKYDSKLLLEIDGWYLQHINNNKLLERHQVTLSEKQNELRKLLTAIEEKEIDIVNFETRYKDALQKLNERELKANDNKINFELKQKMVGYTRALRNGAACPLCGSTEHPQIATIEDVSHQLKIVAEEMHQIKTEREHWQNLYSITQRAAEKKQELDLQIKQAEDQLKIEKESFIEHLSRFQWEDFNPENRAVFEEKKKQSFAIETEIEKKSAEIEKLRKNEANQRENLEKFNQALEDFKKKENELLTKIESNKSHLKILKFEPYIQHSNAAVLSQLQLLKQRNDKTEKLHKDLSIQITDLDKQVEAKKAAIEGLNKQVEQKVEEQKNLKEQIAQQLIAEGFENLKQVEDTLSHKIDVSKVREEINQFTLKFEILKNQIEALADKLSKDSYDDAQFDQQEKTWNESLQKVKELNDKTVELKSEFERLAKAMEKKKDLLKTHMHLKKREENLKIMINLFRGSGFVQYISSIYLHQLCDHANLRFHRMTRNQLRLQLNENNDFVIIDYLNEGRSRSVKTLSGGQSFQVSLSLALALAESVQSHAKAEKNFFFIDEGFGTQDPESVNIVFETLLNLNKEKKIVGIISHVEDLKERIPMILNITKDAERGSLIELQK